MGFVNAILSVLGNLFGWLNKRSDIANSPEMKKNKVAQTEQESVDQGQVEIAGAAKGDVKATKQLRDDLSE